MSPSERPRSASFTAARNALQAAVKAHVPAEQQIPISKLIAAFVAESVREYRAMRNLQDAMDDLMTLTDSLLKKNSKTST